MYRVALFLLLALSVSLSAPGAPSLDVAKAPAVEEIKKAIEELGSKRFAVREKAKKFLMELGQPAEPYLEEAAKNPDEEIASSAKAILERFQWGLYPNTPKAVRDQIEQFRSGSPEERQTAIGGLLKMKEVPFATLRKLLAKEDNPELREQMLVQMYQQVREALPAMLARGDYDSVESMFELILGASPTNSGPDYAAFMYLRGKLDGAIARFEKLANRKDETGQRAAEMLVYLYRCKGDWPAARKAAEQANKDDLVDRVNWQSFDWKALAASGKPPELGRFNWVGAAYDRLAGNRKGFDEKIDEIKKSAEEEAEEAGSLRLVANALLLNGKSNDAIKILADKRRELAFTFDLLCAQMRHKDAFDLVDEARRRDLDPKEGKEKERNELEIRRARMLYLLGEKDAAKQLFATVAEAIKGPQDFTLARNLIKAEARLGLADEALEHAAASIDTLSKGERRGGFGQIFESLFNDDKDAAQTWWSLFRRELPQENAAVAMKRVRDLLAGKLERKKLDEWLTKMNTQWKDENGQPKEAQPDLVRRNRLRSCDALAAAYKAVGDVKKTEEYLTEAAEKTNFADRWIKVGDFMMGKKRYKEAGIAYGKAAKLAQSGQDIEIEDDNIQVLDEQSPALATYLQAHAAALAGDAKEGKRLAEVAHWLPLGNDAVRAKLVEELNKRDWPEMARKEAEMLLKTGWWIPSNYAFGNVLSFLAHQAAKEKDYFTAADYFEKCVVGCLRNGASFVEPTAYILVPESVRVYRARGLLAQNKIDEALQEANANLAVMPGNIDLAIKLVPDLDKLGKKKEADSIYEKVRDTWEKLSKDYPTSAFAHNSTAWIMANCRRDLDAAIDHAKTAVKIEPKNAGYIDTLAEVNFRKGNRDEALKLMQQCTELDAKSNYFRKQLARFKTEPFDSPTPDEGEEDDE